MSGKKDDYPLPRSEYVRIPRPGSEPGERSIIVPREDVPAVLGRVSPEDMVIVRAAAAGHCDLEAAQRILSEAAEEWEQAQ